MTKVFIDGSSGTTGLRIRERLCTRKDIELIALDEAHRKDAEARRDAFQKADVAFLCLPDAAAVEAVELAADSGAVIIDTSTAHRTAAGWTYGMPELTGCKEKIAKAKRIANPGCHASGFIALVAPLVEQGLLARDALLTCFSLTGYSGGGKNMIAEYEDPQRSPLLNAPRQYALGQTHKHLKEMNAICGLENAPVFCPIVADFYSGMEVTVSLFKKDLQGSLADVRRTYASYYRGPLIHFKETADENGFLSAAAFTGRDDMEITVTGNEDRILLVSRFDNLGKGASGAAIQNMNIVLGLPETTGLEI
ncbi:MAG: N-acetyl-gamma-glutamyl-phosphate reductase [Acidaminococcaceae bacterium]|nr:N-acetyl-gamma-glutamyl-phosphate reductase [Acidaminococcaceae bacterium]